jgi:hypothetical protein
VLACASTFRISPITVEHLAGGQFTMDVLLNELAFQKVLLNSIDDTVQNREAAEDEVCAEIRALEKQIRELKRGSTTASQPQHSGSCQSSQKPSSSSSKKPNASTGSGTPYAPAMDGYLSECFPLECNQAHIEISPFPFDLLFSNIPLQAILMSWQMENNGTICHQQPLPPTPPTLWEICSVLLE